MLYIKINNLIGDVVKQDWFTKNDLYVTIQYGNQIRRTTTKWNNDNPIWNEDFIFHYIEGQEINLKLYDANKWSSNSHIFETKFSTYMGFSESFQKDIFHIDMGDVFAQKDSQIYNLTCKNKLLLNKLNAIEQIII